MPDGFGRRDWLKFTAGTAIAAGVAGAQGPHKFFTPDEYAMVDDLTEILIPADELGGGSRAANVAAYIDQVAAEAFDDDVRQTWRKGLAMVDKLSEQINKTPFLKGTPEQRVAVVLQMAANEKKPTTPEEKFFAELKGSTVRGFYSSKIGIHDALDYKGNVYQPGEYAGILPAHPALAKVSGTE